MEINLNASRIVQAGALQPPAKREPFPTARDAAAFSDTAALRAALNQIPEVRPQAVERAKELTASIDYPPPAAVDSIARLLAMHLRP